MKVKFQRVTIVVEMMLESEDKDDLFGETYEPVTDPKDFFYQIDEEVHEGNYIVKANEIVTYERTQKDDGTSEFKELEVTKL